jgi:hypothetical protein
VVVVTLMRLPRLLPLLRRWPVVVLVVAILVVASIKKNEYF